MQPREFVLAALAAAKGQPFSPVQLQKLVFLLDRNVGNRLGGSGFVFEPYHYGPFDSSVYTTVEHLAREGLAEIANPFGSANRRYTLTQAGQAAGDQVLAHFDPPLREYFSQVCNFVRSQSFASLVSSIYKAYPDMKVNSVFKQ